jgi:hypothetical protein
MHVSHISLSPARRVEAWKTIVQPCVASTHLPTYKIIGAAPRPRCSEDDVPIKPVIRRKKPSSTSSSSKKTAPVTKENLFKISMACAREEDLDAPLSSCSGQVGMRRTGSEMSVSNASNSDLPSISEEEE